MSMKSEICKYPYNGFIERHPTLNGPVFYLSCPIEGYFSHRQISRTNITHSNDTNDSRKPDGWLEAFLRMPRTQTAANLPHISECLLALNLPYLPSQNTQNKNRTAQSPEARHWPCTRPAQAQHQEEWVSTEHWALPGVAPTPETAETAARAKQPQKPKPFTWVITRWVLAYLH